MSITSKRGRKVGGQCRSSILNVRTGPRRFFADSAEVAALANLRNKKSPEFITVRPKAVITWTEHNGHRVVDVKRLPAVVQLLKSSQ
jgi:hypothetical protein